MTSSKWRGESIFGEEIIMTTQVTEKSAKVVVWKGQDSLLSTILADVYFWSYFCIIGVIQAFLSPSPSLHLTLAGQLLGSLIYVLAFGCGIREERLEVFDFVEGIQYTKVSWFGRKDSQFINTDKVILHEVVSMQKIIVYLSCLVDPSRQVKNGHNLKAFHIVPLLVHLHPRQSSLQDIFRHLRSFKSSNQVKK